MWTGALTPSPTRTRAGGGAACLAACSDDADLSAAADLWPVRSAGTGRRRAVRPPPALPAALVPLHRPVGWDLLSGGGRRVFPVPAAAGRGRAAGLHGAGGPWRRGHLFLRVLLAFAPRMGLLGGRAGGFSPPDGPPGSVGQRIFEKNGPPRKKPLLFCPQMLYNKKKTISPDRRRTWQKKGKQSSPGQGPGS